MALELPDRDKVATYGMDIGGWLFDCDLDTVVSSDPLETLPATLRAIGYLEAEAGIVKADNTEEGEDKIALGGDVMTTSKGIYKPTLAFTIIETMNVNALNLAYGIGEVNYDNATKVLRIVDSGGRPAPRKLVQVSIINEAFIAREVFPYVEFASRGERTVSNDDFYSYPLVYNIRRVAGVYSDKTIAPLPVVPAG